MTHIQVDAAIKNIDIRKHNDRAFLANVHGHKMKPVDRLERQVMEQVADQEISDYSGHHDNYLAELRKTKHGN